ncbi:hypothetical protein ABDK09_05240 [Vibrio sp. CDRSL-10 TSBA]
MELPLFTYTDEQALGKVASVDTTTVIVEVEDRELLKRLQVNRLAVLQSAKPGQHLIGLISQVTRKKLFDLEEGDEEETNEQNLCKVALIGTMLDRDGTRRDVFRRTLESVS